MQGKQVSGYELRFEANPRRVRVELHGTAIADSTNVRVLHETRLPPAYYFPREDVRLDLMQKTAHHTHCPFKGDASYFSVVTGTQNAMWSYEAPYDEMTAIRERLAFYPDKFEIRPA